jgi:hypothetical protein
MKLLVMDGNRYSLDNWMLQILNQGDFHDIAVSELATMSVLAFIQSGTYEKLKGSFFLERPLYRCVKNPLFAFSFPKGRYCRLQQNP